MIRRFFECRLLSDLILTHGSATEHNVRGLDYIPGNNFRGIVGVKYKELVKWDQKIFHDGTFRFYDAHIGRETFSFTVPLSWEKTKQEESLFEDPEGEKKKWLPEKIVLPSPGEKKGDTKKISSGYFTPGGEYLKPSMNFSMKAAFDLEKRKSRESQMFGFLSLTRGSRFFFPVDFFTENKDLIEAVTAALEGRHTIGRFRTAQYGQVKIKMVKDFTPEDYEKATGSGKDVPGDFLYLYAESPLCFYNKYGEATLAPTYGELLSSPKEDRRDDEQQPLSLELSRLGSFLFSPYNGARQHRDMDRIALAKGSVLVLDKRKIKDFDFLKFKDKCRRGLGFHKNEGMGKVLLNPSFIIPDSQGNPSFLPGDEEIKLIVTSSSDKEDKPIVTSSPKKGEAGKDSKNNSSYEKMTSWITEAIEEKKKEKKILEEFYKLFEDFKETGGITPNQWRMVREKAAKSDSGDSLMKELFDPKEGALITGAAAKQWKETVEKLKKEIKDLVELEQKNPDESVVCPVLILFSEEMAKKAQKQAPKKEQEAAHE